MAAINWAGPLASLDAALAGATGADVAFGTSIRTKLAALGAEYDDRWSAEVSTAKDVFAAEALEVFTAADELARYVEALVPDEEDPGDVYPGDPLVFDLYSSAAILARLEAASKLTENATRRELLAAHEAAVRAAFASKATSTALYTKVAPSNTAVFIDGVRQHVMPIRSIELELVALIAKAAEYVAAVAYP